MEPEQGVAKSNRAYAVSSDRPRGAYAPGLGAPVYCFIGYKLRDFAAFYASPAFLRNHTAVCVMGRKWVHMPGGTFGKFSCPPCPWFLDMDPEVPVSLEKRLLCGRILSGSTFRCAFQPTSFGGDDNSPHFTFTDLLPKTRMFSKSLIP